MSKLFKAGFLLVLIFASSIYAQPTISDEDTLGAFYLNGGVIFESFVKHMHDFGLAENRNRVEEINGNLLKIIGRDGFNLDNQIKEFNLFFEKETMKIVGPIWFSIDDLYRPNLRISGAFKPEPLYEILFKKLGEPKGLIASKRNAELVELAIPGPQFEVLFRIATDSIVLQAKDHKAQGKAGDLWKSLVQSSTDPRILLDAQINFDVVKKLTAMRAQQGRHSICLGNLMAIKNAVEMYQLESGDLMKELDLTLLAEKHYLPLGYKCSEGGHYSLTNQSGVVISCSVHGSIESPKKLQGFKKSDMDPRLEPFKIFKLQIGEEQVLAKLQIIDNSLLEQWVAIGKMQIQTIQHLAANQMGHLPEEQKKFAVKLAESMKCWSEDDWFCLSVSGVTEDALVGAIVVGMESLRAFAMPRYRRGINAEKLQKNQNQIIMDE